MEEKSTLDIKDLEIILHLLENVEESILRHNLKVINEEYNISDVEAVKSKIKLMIEEFPNA
jgi:hypothetical protein